MKLNKKGFTLIELLAVIVILAIIALIATPIILNVISDAQEGADRNAAYGYIEAVENSIALGKVKDPNSVMPTAITTVDAKLVNGTAPESVNLTVSSGNIVGGTIKFKNNTFTVDSKGTVSKSQ